MWLTEFLFSSPMNTATFPPSLSFAGQTILVTGATSGLGLETAIHYVQLGAHAVYITARTSARGAEAQATIEARTGKENIVKVLELNMDTFQGVKNFVDALKTNVPTVDIVLLNAGVHSFGYERSPEGWESNLQVNVLSTALLALLLLPWMQEVKQPGRIQRLGIVSSGSHFQNVDIKTPSFPKSDVLKYWNDEKNYQDPRVSYGVSKLLAQYVTLEIAKLATRNDESPSPLVNSVCPGLIATNLGRHLASKGIIYRILVALLLRLKAQPPDVGARALVLLGIARVNEHGKFMRPYLSDDEYSKEAENNITSEGGKMLRAEVWKEILEVLKNVLQM